MRAIINCTGECPSPCSLEVPGMVIVGPHPQTTEIHQIKCIGEYFRGKQGAVLIVLDQGKVEALNWNLKESETVKALNLVVTAIIDKSLNK